MKLFYTVFAIAAVVVMADDTSVEELLNKGNNAFTAKMFTEVVKENPGKSIVMSAFSVLTPLAQLSLASVGESHDELLRAIGLPNDNATKEVFSLVNRNLRTLKGVELRMASRVYIPEGLELNDDFAAVSRDVFNSEVKNVDFSKKVATAGDINAWVEDQTNHRIKDLVDSKTLSKETRVLLVNAIYFKGSWKDKFYPNATTDRDFYTSKDNTIKVPTMHRTGNYKYAESADLDAKLLEMPYDGLESSLLVILPNKVDGIAELEEKLKDPTILPKAVEGLNNFEVDVYLPKFRIETTTDLKKLLENIDVKNIFTPKANLDNLLKNQGNLYISEATQKAFIEVNEEGAEAAAANEFNVILTATLDIAENKIFEANRPFYFEIRTDNVLFNGVMAMTA